MPAAQHLKGWLRQHDAELFAAGPAGDVALADLRAQDLGELTQHLVSGTVTE